MATTFKTFLNNDVTSTRTLLHEAIPLTGALCSGTYGAFPNGENIKNYAHGIFQSVYDYPYLSSSANQIYDLTLGFHSDSALSSSTTSATNGQVAKKINMYNQMAQVLAGHDHTGSIQKFDQDGNILAGGSKLNECIFINFARLLYKDEIKKGSFEIKLGSNQAFTSSHFTTLTIGDAGAQNDFRVNSPAGEYGILSASAGEATGSPSGLVGLIYYQAGVCVLTASVFAGAPTGSLLKDAYMDVNENQGITGSLTGSTIQTNCDALRHRIQNISYNNTTELNSTIYFCRANHNDFNYSSNPTYLSGSKIVVKNNTLDSPVAYITSVGLYSSDNELLGVAKLSEPLKKTPENELTIRVRLDY